MSGASDSERPSADGPPGIEPPGGLVVRGRDGDLAALHDLLNMGVRVLVVSGEPGTGATSLFRRFAQQLAIAGRELVAVDLAGASQPWHVVARLADALEVPLREPRGLEQAVRRVATAAISAPSRIHLVDHVEPAAVEGLEKAVSAAPGTLWILVGPDRLGVPGEVTYRVGPLTPEAGAAVLADGDPERAAMLEPIARELDGNPLALRMARHALRESTPLALFDRLAAHRGGPLRVLDVLRRSLSEPEREALDGLAVFETPFTLAAAAEVVECELATLEGLRDTGWLSGGPEEWVLHARIRAALRERAPIGTELQDRFGNHLAASTARWVGERYTARWPEARAELRRTMPSICVSVARMIERPRLSAADLACLATLLEGMACLAFDRGAVSPLLEPLERTLKGVGMCLDVDPMVAVVLFRIRGSVFAHLEQWEAAVSDLQRAESLAEKWASPAEVARARFHTGRASLATRRFEDAASAFDEAVTGFDEAGLPEEGVEARALLAEALGLLGEAGAGDAELAGAASRKIAPWLAARVSRVQAVAHRRAGRVEDAVAAFDRAVEGFRGSGRWDAAALARFQLGLLLQGAGRVDAAIPHFEGVETVARRWGDSARRGLILAQLGLAQLERGDRQEAHRTFIRSLSACRAGQDRAGQGTAKGFLGLLHHFSGRLEEAREGYRSALRDLESGGDRRFGALFHSCLGAVEAELGNLEEARILVDLAELQLPEADPSLRDAMVVFHRAIDLANADIAEGEGDTERAKELRDRVHDTLAGLPGQPSNIYLRFARRHLEELVGGPP